VNFPLYTASPHHSLRSPSTSFGATPIDAFNSIGDFAADSRHQLGHLGASRFQPHKGSFDSVNSLPLDALTRLNRRQRSFFWPERQPTMLANNNNNNVGEQQARWPSSQDLSARTNGNNKKQRSTPVGNAFSSTNTNMCDFFATYFLQMWCFFENPMYTFWDHNVRKRMTWFKIL